MNRARLAAACIALATASCACDAPACEPSPLSDWTAWDAAPPSQRLAAAMSVTRVAPEFAFARIEPFTCGGIRHEVAVFSHAATGMEFSLLPRGSFDMGTPPDAGGASASEPRHRVTLTRPLLVARTETTRRAWRRVMRPDSAEDVEDAERPATGMTWFEAQEFCRLAKLELPTEAQWEYACRGGSTADWCCGDDVAELARYAWFGEPAESEAHVVATKAPNACGLFDMHGNIMEWCADGHGPYAERPVVDPVGVAGSSVRVHRGGSVRTPAQYARSAFHSSFRAPDTGHARLGFRPVRTLAP